MEKQKIQDHLAEYREQKAQHERQVYALEGAIQALERLITEEEGERAGEEKSER
jgi:hypothetical protein